MTSGKSTILKSSHVRFGKRTYFFDVNQNSRGKYLKITQSKFPRVPYGVKIVSATSGPHKDNLVVSTGCMLETP